MLGKRGVTIAVVATTTIGDGTAVTRGETPTEAAAVTTAAVAGSNQAAVDADKVPTGGGGHSVPIHGFGNANMGFLNQTKNTSISKPKSPNILSLVTQC